MKRLFGKFVLKYLQILTRSYVKRNKIEIFGLTGSIGKTTLTIALYNILSKKFSVGMTYRDGHGLNSESGIPFALLDVHVDGYRFVDWIRYVIVATIHFIFTRPKYEMFIIEMGVDKPGDMDFILSMTRADLGIFLSISKVHTENFEKLLKTRHHKNKDALLKLVLAEKAKVIMSLEEDGWAVLNYDEEMIRSLQYFTKAQVITFGLKKGADVQGIVKKTSEDGFIGEVRYGNQSEKIKIQKYLVNEKVFTTLLAAITVGITYDISLLTCIGAVETMALPPGRMTKIEGIKDTIIIDSSYNASKLSMLEALDNLELFEKRRKIAVLGDMRELGVESKAEHEEVAEKARKIVDEFVLIGPMMKEHFLTYLIERGVKQKQVHHFDNTYDALEFVKNKGIHGREAILVKGSQNTLYLEIVVEGIMKHPDKADALLCRRGSDWDKKRKALMRK